MKHDNSSIRDITDFQNKLMSWYQKNQRPLPWRETSDPYKIWISEVMLQQTQVNTVIPYYERFLAAFPDIYKLAHADIQEVLKKWEGLGYYARARNLHRAAKIITSVHGGNLPDDPKTLQRLPGIGDYIAAAVLSIAFGKPSAVVDGNVKRVIARLETLDAPVNQPASHLMVKAIVQRLLDKNNPGTFNQALMELGALVCTPKNPSCGICPVQSFCKALKTGATDRYPVRIRARQVPEVHVTIGVVFKNDQVLITRRKPDGLLGGLWEFPGGKVLENETPENACIREIREEVSLNVEIHTFVKRIRHVYTHFKMIADVFVCRHVSGRIRLNGPVDFKWIRLSDIEKFPFPKANHKFIPELEDRLRAEG
jgi:A/G-specific adenine glycosylase